MVYCDIFAIVCINLPCLSECMYVCLCVCMVCAMTYKFHVLGNRPSLTVCRFQELTDSEDGVLDGAQLDQALQNMASFEHAEQSEDKLRYAQTLTQNIFISHSCSY